ncbi:MAG: sigma-54 interaction domain-containing protein [Nitrospiria bacterium]
MSPSKDQKSSQFYLSILNSMSESIVVIKEDFTVDYANEAVLCNNQDNVSEKKCYALLHGRKTPCEECPCMSAFEQGKPFRVIRRDSGKGTGTQKELLAYPVFGEDGRVDRVIEVLRDLPKQEGVEGSESSFWEAGKGSFCGMIGQSKKMYELFHMIRIVAPSSATVLIYGESGTGKERVAQAIHQMSDRKDHPFVAIDCGALPETLLESELFGHVKGAFTGAIMNKKGLFEEAEGGTLFLDEIGDTSLVFQSKLLRALQEGEARPVGGMQNVKINARLIAATNRSLKEAIAKKTFREDLYYRLAVMPIMIPPLRGRLDDIPFLAAYFIKKYAAQNGKGKKYLSKEASELLLRMPWKGNVRELENVIERGVLMSQGPEISLESLLIVEEVNALGYTPSDTSLFASTQEALHRVERERILESLQQYNGNKSMAARALGISRASFYNKLKRYQIPVSA